MHNRGVGLSLVDIYHIVGNYHMADGVIVHVPALKLLVEADLTTQDWDFNWWGDSLMNNIEYRKITVDTNLAVHAQKPFPLADVVAAIERQVRNAQAFCRRAAEAQFFQPGCPIHTTGRCRRPRSERPRQPVRRLMKATRVLFAFVVLAGLAVTSMARTAFGRTFDTERAARPRWRHADRRHGPRTDSRQRRSDPRRTHREGRNNRFAAGARRLPARVHGRAHRAPRVVGSARASDVRRPSGFAPLVRHLHGAVRAGHHAGVGRAAADGWRQLRAISRRRRSPSWRSSGASRAARSPGRGLRRWSGAHQRREPECRPDGECLGAADAKAKTSQLIDAGVDWIKIINAEALTPEETAIV